MKACYAYKPYAYIYIKNKLLSLENGWKDKIIIVFKKEGVMTESNAAKRSRLRDLKILLEFSAMWVSVILTGTIALLSSRIRNQTAVG